MAGTHLAAGTVLRSRLLLQRPAGSRRCSFRQPFSGRLARSAAVNIDDFLLDVPDIDGDLRSVQTELGAVFNDDGIVVTFGNTDKAIDALEAGVVLVDRSHWGRLRVVGDGRRDFLHNQSTNDFTRVAPGQACDTVFVTATARTIDLATALVLEQGILVLTHPSTRHQLLARFHKYIFPADMVTVMDVTDKTCMFTLVGPESDNILRELKADGIVGQAHGAHTLFKLKDKPVMAVAHSGLATPGYTFITDESVAADLYSAFAAKGCILMGEQEWQRARILEGRPEPGAELTEEVNPLEAGLYSTVSVSKGCFIGQETLAKVANLDAVKQQLWGLRLSATCEPGAEITIEGTRVGRVTSVTTDLEGRPFGLGYIRCRSGGAQVQLEGAIVKINGSPAVVASLPFATRAFREGSGPAGQGRQEAAADPKEKKEAGDAAAAAAKEAKLKVSSEDEPSTSSSSNSSSGEARVWRRVVDEALPPYRKARVVDVRGVLLGGRPELRLPSEG